jgi:hypothetical protein
MIRLRFLLRQMFFHARDVNIPFSPLANDESLWPASGG